MLKIIKIVIVIGLSTNLYSTLKYKEFKLHDKKSKVLSILKKKYRTMKVKDHSKFKKPSNILGVYGKKKFWMFYFNKKNILHNITVNLGTIDVEEYNILLERLEDKYGKPEFAGENEGLIGIMKRWKYSKNRYFIMIFYHETLGVNITYTDKVMEKKYKKYLSKKKYDGF